MNLAFEKKYLVGVIALCCSLLGAGLATAGPSDRYDQGRGQDSRDDGQRGRDGRADARQQQGQDSDSRDPRAYQRQEPRRMIEVQAPERGDSRRGGRMSIDERRDLRRQINEAGQDIYANPPRR